MSELYSNEINQIYKAIARLPYLRVKVAIPKLRKLGWLDYQIAGLFGLDPADFSKKFGKGRQK